MKITCQCCKKKFEPLFADLLDNPQDASYVCPHCRAITYRRNLSDYERWVLDTKELRREGGILG